MSDSKHRNVSASQKGAVIKRTVKNPTSSSGSLFGIVMPDDAKLERSMVESIKRSKRVLERIRLANSSDQEITSIGDKMRTAGQGYAKYLDAKYFVDQDIPATEAELAEALKNWRKQPLYKHFKGGWYRIIGIRKKKYGYTVKYISLHFGTDHPRDAAEFFGNVVRKGYTGPRFTPHAEPIPATQNPAWMAKYGHLA